jgi:two-component system response regulator DesR
MDLEARAAQRPAYHVGIMSEAKPLRIAIGEDNTDLAQMVSMLIGLQPDLLCVGYAPTTSALEALVEAHRPDACLIDLQLADGSALPLIRHLRAAYPACRLVAFSGDGSTGLEPACLEAGCDDLVRKDGRPMAVIEALRAGRR